MKHSYEISGMTCAGCTQIVHDLLSKVQGVKGVTVHLDTAMADVETEMPIKTAALKEVLEGSLYQLTGKVGSDAVIDEMGSSGNDESDKNRSLVSDYLTANGKLDDEALQAYLASDFDFDGAIHLYNAADYLKMIRDHVKSGINNIFLGNDIKAVFTEGKEAYAIYDALTSTAVKRVPFFESITLREGKIASTKVKFDRQRMKALMQEVRKH